ncbi:MAG: helicase, partial [Methylobacteriaceae bacterium]|nr:helicase [Methylobacteriaceae bacterium]
RGVTALLGPTNTGKTHFAIDRMLGHSSGIIGLPLRLLAREVYNRVVERAGEQSVALITGEEKIKPPRPRFWVATVEAMPRDLDVAFVAIDEIQLAADLDRGHVFTDRLLNRRGREETLVIGAQTMRRAVEELLPGVSIASRPRLSNLTFAGERKITRLPHRTAVVAFSAEEVYAIAELVRRQRGGAAVVLGALSPRTRNAQVAMYQNGDVDYIIATDAIGMGLNLDVDHVAFAGDRKFDGWQYRRLTPAEFGQIAGRAGRYLRAGTFGTTGRCPPFDEDLVEALEDHRFDPVRTLQWRNAQLDFASIASLQASLDELPREAGLSRAPLAEDVMILDIAARDEQVQRAAKTGADVQRLWEVCQIPDYRKVSPSAHSELVLTVFGFIVRAGRIPDDWFQRQLAMFDRTDGDIDALSARIAQVRTWTYIANRSDWLRDPEHWQSVTRRVEDSLSDALHERLAQRFVDRRTSVLMRRLRENAMLEAQVTGTGDVMVEGQHVGHLHGFRFTADPQASGEAARALNAAAQKALATEIEARANRVHEAVDEAFVLANDGNIRWLGESVGKLAPGDKALSPLARVLADDQLTGSALESVQRRLDLWLAQHVKKLLGPLLALEAGEGLEGMARGVAFQIAEALGVLERSRVADEVKSLDQMARAALRKSGVRFGAYHIYLTPLLKPAPRALAAQLWALKHGGTTEQTRGLDEVPHFAASGRTSFPADKDTPRGLYRAAGFRVCGERAVRVDILERLADLIRPAINYRPGITPGTPPPGAADGDGFVVTVSMTSLAGCSGEDFASILRSLGYVMERRKGPAITVPLIAAAATAPAVPAIGEPQQVTGGDAATPDGAQQAMPEQPTQASSEADAALPPGAEEAMPEQPAAASGEADAAQSELSPPATAADDAVGQPATSPAQEPAEAAAPQTSGPLAQPEQLASPTKSDGSDREVTPGAEPSPGFAEAAPSPGVEAAPAIISDGPPELATPPADEAMPSPAQPPMLCDSDILPTAEPAVEVAGSVEPPPVAEKDGEAAVAAESPPAEEPLIEVWHPRRHHQSAPRRPERRPRHRGSRPGGPQVRSQPAAPASESAQGHEGEVAAASSAQPAHGPQRADRPERHKEHRRPDAGRRRSEGKPEGEGERGRPRHADRERSEGGRRERRDFRPSSSRGEERPFATTEKPRGGDRQPDPDSPFAKLL